MQLHKHRQHEYDVKRGQALLETDRISVLNKANELTRNIGFYKRFVQGTIHRSGYHPCIKIKDL